MGKQMEFLCMYIFVVAAAAAASAAYSIVYKKRMKNNVLLKWKRGERGIYATYSIRYA